MSKRYVGERVLQNCGEVAEIIKLLPNGKCRVRFDSGFTKECTRKAFSDGCLSINSSRLVLGEKLQQNCGAVAEVIKLNEDKSCTVRWEDGTESDTNNISFRKCSVLPIFLISYGRGYAYSKTIERLLGMYFDKTLAHYVGVLRRTDGTRYVRVLD